jgi:hypothetical protein
MLDAPNRSLGVLHVLLLGTALPWCRSGKPGQRVMLVLHKIMCARLTAFDQEISELWI